VRYSVGSNDFTICLQFSESYFCNPSFSAVCQKLLEDYPDVHVLLGSRDAQRGQDAVSKLCRAVPGCESRLEAIALDVSDEGSVRAAANQVSPPLYGVVNNAGRGFGLTLEDNLGTNYWGVRNICDAFIPMLQTSSESSPARIVNVGSAAGPMFVAKIPSSSPLKEQLSKPWTIPSIKDLDAIASRKNPPEVTTDQHYGYSKALLAAYTYQLSRDYPALVVNTVTPGFIDTDMTQGFGASNPPSKGAEPIVRLLMSSDFVGIPQGRYYGSDVQRSPLDVYRGPGEPVYEGPDGPDQ
jgi:carbonyl reductase 1